MAPWAAPSAAPQSMLRACISAYVCFSDDVKLENIWKWNIFICLSFGTDIIKNVEKKLKI